MIHILWKPALINAGAILGVYTAGICIKDYWHPPRFIEYRGKLIPTRWVIGTLATGLICMGLVWALRPVAHHFDIFLFLSIFGISVCGKSLAIYLVRDRAKDREVIDEEE
jgi:hypothetical protein